MHRSLSASLLTTTAAIAWFALGDGVSAQSPQAPVVASGSISVTRENGGTVVTQTTGRGVIDWRSFSIGPQEYVRFDQPGRSSVTLNRVTGAEVSRLDGALSATGQVWLANPNGVMIGPGGQVNVGGLLATTGRLDADAFMASGAARIDQIARNATIANAGTVTIAEGGYAALAAAAIRNDGVIQARAGSVALGAGRAMTLDFAGDRLISFQVTQPLDQAPAGADALVANAGTLIGGAVQISARAAKGVIDNVINLRGHVVSNAVRIEGGVVMFGDGGTVQAGGRIDASSAIGVGGKVEILGEKVGVMDGAVIDASGAEGGGAVLVGGDWQGKGATPTAQIAYLAPTAKISVDATRIGPGGKAVVWADDTTRIYGTISAQGGVAGGDGGQVETSGKRNLTVGPDASVSVVNRAASGKAGAWLLDPTDVTIAAGSAGAVTAGMFNPSTNSTIGINTITTALATGNVTIQTTGGATGNGDITMTAGTLSYDGAASRTLALLASRNILIQGADRKILLSGGAHTLLLNSGATATIQGDVNGGVIITGATIKSTGAGSLIKIGGGVGGDLLARRTDGIGVTVASATLASGGALILRGASTSSHGVAIQNTSTVTADGDISITGSATANANTTYGVQLLGTGGVKSTGGSITVVGDSTGNATDVVGVGITTDVLAPAGSISITGKSSLSLLTSIRSMGVKFLLTTTGTLTISAGGAVVITGEGGKGTSMSTGNRNHGIGNEGSYTVLIESTGGDVTLTGVRGAGQSQNIQLDNTTVRTVNGTLRLDGSATSGGMDGSLSNSWWADGVSMGSNSTLTTQGGVISVLGAGATTGSTSNGNRGVNAQDATIKATGPGGSISLTAIAGAGSQVLGLLFNASSTLSTAGGAINITSDNISGTPGVMTAGSGAISIRPYSTNGISGIPASAITGTPSSVTFGRSDIAAPIALSGFNMVANTVINSGGGAVTVTGQINDSSAGVHSLTVNSGGGTVSFNGVGATVKLADLTVNGGPVAGSYVGTTGSQYYGGGLALGGVTGTLSTTGGAVMFGGSVSGSNKLFINSGAGSISFAGSATGFNELNLTGSSGTLYAGGDISVSANYLSFPMPVILKGAVVFKNPTTGAITFSSTIDGGYAATISSGNGAVRFGGLVGGTTPLNSLSVVGAGAVTFAGGGVSTTGTQSYAGNVTLAADTTLSTNNANLIFTGSIAALNAGVQKLSIKIGDAVVVGGGSSLAPVLASQYSTASAPSVASSPSRASQAALTSAPSYASLASVASIPSQASNATTPSSPSQRSQASVASVASHASQASMAFAQSQPSQASTPSSTSIASQGSTASQATVAPQASSASQATVASQASTASQVTVASQASSASQPTSASTPSVATTPTVATVASVPTQSSAPSTPTVSVFPLITAADLLSRNLAVTAPVFAIIGPEPLAVVIARVAAQLSAAVSTPSGGGLAAILATAAGGGAKDASDEAATPAASAAGRRNAMSRTASGGLVPPGPASVAETGAALASAPTVKVDAEDTGGEGGQAVTAAGKAAKPASPGAFSQAPATASASQIRREPPLAQMPSEIDVERTY